MTAWPADPAAVRAAARFLRSVTGRVVVASHNDADGLAAAVIVLRALAARGVNATPMPARRGEHVHHKAMRARLRSSEADALVVVDMGSRPETILDAVPTLVIDHHDATGGVPPNAVVVNGFDRAPVAPSSVLAYVVCQDTPGIETCAWLAALGAVADLGTAEPFEALTGVRARGGAWTKAVSLINAARRAPEDDAEAALQVLAASTRPQDITSGRVAGAERLERYRRTVQSEVARCSRVPPRLLGDVALIRFTSAAQVHPIVATRWSRRLAPAIVVVANDGFLPGRVNFAIRSARDVNLLHWLRALPFTPAAATEFGHGHPGATGGSLSPDDFEQFVNVLQDMAAERGTKRTRSQWQHR